MQNCIFWLIFENFNFEEFPIIYGIDIVAIEIVH